MDPKVRLEVEIEGEFFAALVARVRFFTLWYMKYTIMTDYYKTNYIGLLRILTVWTSMWRLSFALSRKRFSHPS